VSRASFLRSKYLQFKKKFLEVFRDLIGLERINDSGIRKIDLPLILYPTPQTLENLLPRHLLGSSCSLLSIAPGEVFSPLIDNNKQQAVGVGIIRVLDKFPH